VVVSVPVGIVALLLSSLTFFLLFRYCRSRRSRRNPQVPIDLLGLETFHSASVLSHETRAMNYDKTLPQTHRTSPLPRDEDLFSPSPSSISKQRTGPYHRPISLLSPSIKPPPNIYPHRRVSSLNRLGSDIPYLRGQSSKGDLRIANLTDQDTFFLQQISTPTSSSPLQTCVERPERVSWKRGSPDDVKSGRKSFRLTGNFKKTSRYSVHTPDEAMSKKIFKEYVIATSSQVDSADPRYSKSEKRQSVVNFGPQTSKLAINIPMKFLYLDQGQKSALSEVDKGPETALPPYSSPGNGYPLRPSMFFKYP